jgi:hypothetical protein
VEINKLRQKQKLQKEDHPMELFTTMIYTILGLAALSLIATATAVYFSNKKLNEKIEIERLKDERMEERNSYVSI